MKQDRFLLSFFQDYNRASPHFAPSPCGSWNGHTRSQAIPVVSPIEFRELGVRFLQQKANCLSRIQGAAAAERNNRIALICQVGVRSLDDILFDWVWMHFGENEPVPVLARSTES